MLSLKEISKLQKKSVRDELGLFLLEGKKVFAEAYANHVQLEQILATDKFLREQRQFFQELKINDRDVVAISDHHAALLTGTETPQGIFAVAKKPVVTLEDLKAAQLVGCFDGVRDPGNLGTMLRTADWFGVNAIMVDGAGVDPYNDKVLRGTMGSLFHLKIYVSSDLAGDLAELQQVGFKVVVTRPEAPSSLPASGFEKMCLVMGNESLGTSAEVDALADANIAIPRYGHAESLNVAVSFGIILQQLVAEKNGSSSLQ